MLIICQISYVRALDLPRGAPSAHRLRIFMVGSVNHLVLSLNAIESIPPLTKSDERTKASALRGLAHIKSLTLSFNNLRSWADINALADYCPILETLNITSNPIIEGQSRSYVLFTTPFLISTMVPQRSTVELSS